MLHVRSAVLTVLFFGNWVLFALMAAPILFASRKWAVPVFKAWSRSCLVLLRVVMGIRVEVRGAERIPPGALLVASKHQSAFEIFALAPLFDDPAFVLKAELNRIPLFGMWVRKLGMVSIDRSRGVRALKQLSADSRKVFLEQRQLIIFPEGTRQAPGADPDYKVGTYFMYDGASVPCLPIALNSGLCWPRRSFLKYPGTIIIDVLEPIPPGLDRKRFNARLETAIETASDRLLVEAAASDDAPPLGDEAKARLAQLQQA